MKHSAYKNAGVDVDLAANLIKRIKPHTASTNRPGVMSAIGGFGAIFDLKATGYNDPLIISSTDGVGTKIKIAIDNNIHNTIGIDAVAMCVNDLIVQGGEPLFFLDYFATGALNNDVAEAVIAGVAEGCRQAGCGLIGGETAEMPGLYAKGDYDLAGFSVGAVERTDLITGDTIAAGDIILGLASSGIHSNGFSLVRKIMADNKQGIGYSSPAPFAPAQTMLDVLIAPTKIYVKSILAALKVKNAKGQPAIKGMVHVTGGGFIENVPRVLPENVKAVIEAKSWTLPPIFGWLRDQGNLTPDDLAGTLNCGIGYIVVCPADKAEEIKAALQASGEIVYAIGHVLPRQAGEDPIEILNKDKAWGA
jgi:phosphoribosylformylglycinamidine cyclo-ligase